LKVFISYSSHDYEFVNQISNFLSDELSVYFWDKDKIPGEQDWPQIEQNLKNSDVVVVIISQSTIEKGFTVGQEVGRALELKKKLIPLVDKKIESQALGMLKNITPICFDSENPKQSLVPLNEALKSIKTTKEQESNGLAFMGFGALLFLLMAKE
jgi:hypothetical protein